MARSQFTQVPNWLIEDASLSPEAFKLACYFLRRSSATGYAWPKQDAVVAETGMPLRTVQRAQSELKSRGLLKIGTGKQKYNIGAVWETKATNCALEKSANMAEKVRQYGGKSEGQTGSPLSTTSANMAANPKPNKTEGTDKNVYFTHAEGRVNNICPPPAGADDAHVPVGPSGTHSIAADGDAGQSAMVCKPKGNEPACVFCDGEGCGDCKRGAAPVDLLGMHDAAPAAAAAAFVPEDADGSGYAISEAIWALNRTLRDGTPGPNDGLAATLCDKFARESVRQQVEWLPLRVDFAPPDKPVTNPFGLLRKMIERKAAPPRTHQVNPDRIVDYANAVRRRRIELDEVPAYAKRAVEHALARHNQPSAPTETAIPF